MPGHYPCPIPQKEGGTHAKAGVLLASHTNWDTPVSFNGDDLILAVFFCFDQSDIRLVEQIGKC